MNERELQDFIENISTKVDDMQKIIDDFAFSVSKLQTNNDYVSKEKIEKIFKNKIKELLENEVFITTDENGNKVENIEFSMKLLEIVRDLWCEIKD